MIRFISERAKQVEIQPQTSIDTTGLVNLGSGTPDFRPPDFILDAMSRSIQDGQVQYTAWAGMPRLREAVAVKMERENGLTIDPDGEVLVTTGAQEALMSVLMTTLNPGDEVLIADPHYAVYTRVAKIAGATMVPVPTSLENAFTARAADYEAHIGDRTKAIILVSPSNPTGTVLPRPVLEEIVALAEKHDLMLISDEIYEHYVFGDAEHTTVATLPGARDRTVSIYSLSKGYALTGVRLGYVVAPRDFLQAMLPFHHAMTICAPVTAQHGAVPALREPRDWFVPILAEYDDRRRAWMSALDAAGLAYNEPRGAYYVFFDIRSTGLDAGTFVRRAREEAKITLGVGGQGFIRGSLMQSELAEGLARLTTFVDRLA
jgi:aspartate/methionine/tyrosine aminotransferase